MGRVLLTGASGFLAAHILDLLIARGHTVRGTVRSQQKADQIMHSNPSFKGVVDFAIVPELNSPDAFDSVFQSESPFTDVIHVASPYYFSFTDAKRDMIDPAINGTVSLLESAKKHASSVKRFVLTSSFAAMSNAAEGNWPGHTYSEEDWNPVTYSQALQDPDKHVAYRASKKFAEQAVWNFIEKQKPNFDLVVICPPQMFGPMRQHVANVDAMNTSSKRIYSHVHGDYAGKNIPPTGVYPWVDVRDAALAHVRALEVPEAGGQRFFVTEGLWCTRSLIDLLARKFPELKTRLATAGTQGDMPAHIYQINNEKSIKFLGLKYAMSFHNLQTCGDQKRRTQ